MRLKRNTGRLSSLTPINRAWENNLSSPHNLPLSRTCCSNHINYLQMKKLNSMHRVPGCAKTELMQSHLQTIPPFTTPSLTEEDKEIKSCAVAKKKNFLFLSFRLPSAGTAEALLILGKARAGVYTTWLCWNWKWRKRHFKLLAEHCDPTGSSCILVSITHQQQAAPPPPPNERISRKTLGEESVAFLYHALGHYAFAHQTWWRCHIYVPVHVRLVSCLI